MGAEYKMDSILRGRISKLTVLCANEGCEAKCAVYQMRDHLTSCKGKNGEWIMFCRFDDLYRLCM